jgi:hypothetical protein
MAQIVESCLFCHPVTQLPNPAIVIVLAQQGQFSSIRPVEFKRPSFQQRQEVINLVQMGPEMQDRQTQKEMSIDQG